MAIEHIEHLVKPCEPTVLGAQSHFELTALDLLIAHSVWSSDLQLYMLE